MTDCHAYRQVKKACEVCGKPLILKNQRDVERKRFCNRVCLGSAQLKQMHAQPGFTERIVAAAHTADVNHKRTVTLGTGETHPSWKGGRVERDCLCCGKPFKARRYRIEKELGKYCSEVCAAAHRRSSGVHRIPRPVKTCRVCGRPFQYKKANDKNHGKPRELCSIRCAGIRAATIGRKNRKNGTKIEVALESLLLALGANYEKEKPLLGLTVADFFIAPDLVVYVDGDYWHSKPKAVERDLRINQGLLKAGFRVLRFSEAKIYQDFNNIKTRLSNALYLS